MVGMACRGPYVKRLQHFLWISAIQMLYLFIVIIIIIIIIIIFTVTVDKLPKCDCSCRSIDITNEFWCCFSHVTNYINFIKLKQKSFHTNEKFFIMTHDLKM